MVSEAFFLNIALFDVCEMSREDHCYYNNDNSLIYTGIDLSNSKVGHVHVNLL